MRLTGEGLQFSGNGRRSNPWRVVALLALIAAGVLLVRLVEAGAVEPLFQATPTPTRTTLSFYQEAQAHFSAGDMGRAIQAYKQAVELQPQDPTLLAELARVQTYYSSLQPTAEQREAQLAEARESIDFAVELDPDNGFSQAVRALVYDWSASAYAGKDVTLFEDFLKDAAESAEAAQRLDPNNLLVKAFKAEVLLDAQNWAQANDLASQAAAQAEANPGYTYNLDVHRVYAQVLETGGAYNAAIQEYRKAVALNPNLTFLYLKIGANYRRLRDVDNALENFARAAQINEQNNVQDPIPYLAIGRTYLQEGQFFIAARNVERAVALDPGNPELYGFLGVVYHRARNYESAVEVLRCAVDGCSAEQSGVLLCDVLQIFLCEDDSGREQFGSSVPGLPLDNRSLEYYYTYGSVLAFDNQCSAAEAIAGQLMAAYGDDLIVSGIVAENRALCAGNVLPPAPEASPEVPQPGAPPSQNS